MRPPVVVISLLVALALAATASAMTAARDGVGGGEVVVPPQDAAAPVFVLTGSGYGHGVGMSQYGAFAQAQAGNRYTDILSFYYPGTTLGTASPTTVRVLLAAAARSLTISSPAPFTVQDATGATYQLPAGRLTLRPDLQVTVGLPTQLVAPLAFAPTPGALLSLGKRTYRGTLQVTSGGTSLQAVDAVPLEAYVESVVAGEMPSSWPADALEAQAVAARSYALASITKGKPWDLYADPRSQQYLGVSAETAQATSATSATAGQVLLYGGKVAATFYSSSSGGQTASALDAFGLSLPYLPSQADPWDTVSPFHVWRPRAYTGVQLAQAFGLSSPVTDVQSQLSPSGRIASLVLLTTGGDTIAVAGAEVRKRLALRSTAFHLGTLRFVTPGVPTTVGASLRLTGVARDVRDTLLERLDPVGTWVPVLRRLRIASDGSFAAVVRLTATTTYRLSASGLPGPALTIPVLEALG